MLRLAGSLAAGWLLGAPREAAAAARKDRTLSFYAVHTGERLTVEYYADGTYQPNALLAVNWVLRDHHSDQARAIDPRLLDQLFLLRGLLGNCDPYHVVSGYRSAETNAMKRRLGHSGVAEHSFHIEGKAIDLFLPDRQLDDVHRAALSLATGGVGYYPQSGFVHLDTGPFRTW